MANIKTVKKATKKILCDIVFLSSGYGLNHERLMLTEKQIADPKKAMKVAFQEAEYHPDRGESVLIKPVAQGHTLCEVVYEHRHGNDTEVVWLPDNYKDFDEAEIVTAVFESDFEPDRDEFLTIIPIDDPEFKIIKLGK